MSAIEENEVGNTHVNEKGWVVGEGIDGRRVRVIIRGSSMPTIVFFQRMRYCPASLRE